MYLKSLELSGFKSFGKKENLDFDVPISAIVGPNGSGKSNIAEAFRFVLGEQSIKSMRGKKGEDLIWGGGKNTARSNRASVKVIFDNTKRFFDLDFDEVSIERTVHRDGVNQYAINGSQVRLRDVVELLAAANIGSSGHHIISQGEADRILNTSPKERREMIEDALGLKVHQYKLAESEKKLEKTKENIEQVEALRKEIAPHMRFLQRQVEKVEKTRLLRDDLQALYEEYFKRESVYLSWQSKNLKHQRQGPEEALSTLEGELVQIKEILEKEHRNDAKSKEIIELETKLRTLREERDAVARSVGALEGEIRAEERNLERQQKEKSGASGERFIPLHKFKEIVHEVDELVREGERRGVVEGFKDIVLKVQHLIRSFVEKQETLSHESDEVHKERSSHLEELKEQKVKKAQELENSDEHGKTLEARYANLKEEIESVRDKSREAERSMFDVMTKQNELRAQLGALEQKERDRKREEEMFQGELEEGAALVGRAVLAYDNYLVVDSSGEELDEVHIAQENREEQTKRKREIEKIKIRLEEFGSSGGEEILKEYKEIEERDKFLEREVEDLHTSAESLREIMTDLEEKLQSQFRDGIEKINKEFQQFFAIMFGGGAASLKLVRAPARRRATNNLLLEEGVPEVEDSEEGIDISITLPRKRIKGLVMLSGGERALTSIALLFAMSQVNPPPFLILDETDAALDEANSKRYGDMIENLSSYSQLILITHNRETMSRAHILYGVTMGSEGLSKLLSVKFDEAVQVAK